MESDNTRMSGEVTLAKIESILRLCARDKSPGPDRWTVEFFIGFWDMVGPEILALVEETRKTGYISGALNTTFIALIPKYLRLPLIMITNRSLFAIFSIKLLQRL